MLRKLRLRQKKNGFLIKNPCRLLVRFKLAVIFGGRVGWRGVTHDIPLEVSAFSKSTLIFLTQSRKSHSIFLK